MENQDKYYKAAVEMLTTKRGKNYTLKKYKIDKEDFDNWADGSLDLHTLDTYHDIFIYDNKRW